ncbi:MAG: aromatic amino acid ammonia-lyase, partial [Streptosporangiaceae bacterium]
AAARALAAEAATRRPVYGRTTGVGGNRDEAVEEDLEGHGLRLLRSHAGGVGPLLPSDVVRAMLVVRVNQLAAGGSGIRPEVVDALVAALGAGALPPVRAVGAIGTADLSALAATGLALAGELPWVAGGQVPPIELDPGDALPLISSNACTLAQATLAWHEAERLLVAATAVAALSFLAVRGNAEAYAAEVQRVRPHPGQVDVAARLRALLTACGSEPARVQDPYGLRCVPQVHGAVSDALDGLRRVLDVELNAATENPLVSRATGDVFHHGNFHLAHVALALDQARAALVPASALSASRLGTLMDPEITGLRPFLATGPAASSGLMIVEYVSADAHARLCAAAVPASTQSVHISRGLEEHASFAWQGARLLVDALVALRTVLASELVATVRALRLRRAHPRGPLAHVLRAASEGLSAEMADRPSGDDIETATRTLARLGDVVDDAVGDAPQPTGLL